MNSLDTDQAVASAQSGRMEELIRARSLAEDLGYRSLKTNGEMPLMFAQYPLLVEGFQEGLADAKCARELMRQGLL